MTQLITFLTVVGLIEAAFVVGSVLYGTYLWVSGIAPVLLRLGNGLASRKIALFASGDNRASLRSLLVDSKLFRSRNICEVPSEKDFECTEGASIFLVYWPDWADHIDDVLQHKPESCVLIVYQPYDQGRIPEDQMKKLDGKRHTAVANFRGRLLNDIVTSIITTSYEKD